MTHSLDQVCLNCLLFLNLHDYCWCCNNRLNHWNKENQTTTWNTGKRLELSTTSLKPLNPKSDKHLISPYKITPESHMKVMRIKEMITREGTFWFANKFSLSARLEMYKEQSVVLKIWENSVPTLLTIIKVASKTIVFNLNVVPHLENWCYCKCTVVCSQNWTL